MASTTVKTDDAGATATSSSAAQPATQQAQSAPSQSSTQAQPNAPSAPSEPTPGSTMESKTEKKPVETLINFGVYCQSKGIPERHMAGMQAYTTVRQATVSQWEQIFQTY